MGFTSIPDFNAPASKVASPESLAHLVLRAANFEQMIEFYLTFLGAHLVFRNDAMAFITYDDEHHRIALVKAPGTKPKDPKSAGLDHMAFTFSSLADLLLAYRHRKERGIVPVWSVNHGPTMSLYYMDPDGNRIETQSDNMGPEAATALMNSKEFAENALGVDVDPEDLIARLQKGESEADLTKRVDVGARSLESIAHLV